MCVILVGTALLSLSIASVDGSRAPFVRSLFTSVSATCVTGLVVADTGTTWSLFGQAVILCMIQIGGIGFMMFGVLFALVFKKTVTPRTRVILSQTFNLDRFDGLVRISRRVIVGTFAFEFLGAAVLSLRFIPIFGVGQGIWKSIFHSVSAFCNAGFDIMGGYSGTYSSFTAFSGDLLVNITLCMLVIIGGIGFVVWDDIYERIKRGHRMSVYSKFVLVISAGLILFGALSIGVFEWDNPDTVGNMPVGEKLLSLLFQSVSPRTAGFNTIDLAAMTPVAKLVMIFLMFIGGASASTAGGIKVVTFGLLVCSVLGVLRGRKRVTLFMHSVKIEDVLRAYSVAAIQLMATLAATVFLMAGGIPTMTAFFETFSASGTVGLSLALTPSLAIPQLVILILLMFFGRVGILTVTYAIAGKINNYEPIHAETHMLVG